MFCTRCINAATQVNHPFESCAIVTSLFFVLNDQIEKCVTKLIFLNTQALGYSRPHERVKMLNTYQEMVNIISHLEDGAHYIVNNCGEDKKAFFNEIFFNKPKEIGPKLFQNYNDLFYKTQSH